MDIANLDRARELRDDLHKAVLERDFLANKDQTFTVIAADRNGAELDLSRHFDSCVRGSMVSNIIANIARICHELEHLGVTIPRMRTA